ncbi:hypothetical protein GCM10027403_12250 [Arthrobacter tecti]
MFRKIGTVLASVTLLTVGIQPAMATPQGLVNTDATVVEENGQLSVDGSFLVNSQGDPVQLRGMSSHGLQYFPEFVNREAIEWLRDDWGISVFRAAMYTEGGGYIDNPEPVTQKVREAVNAAVDLGIYVIVDWHAIYEGDPNKHREEAIEFFDQMAAEYSDVPNVIWEIANEPNGDTVTWQDSVKPYAEAVIPAIREHDPDNPIIVGSSTWSQDIHIAAQDPLADENVLYALHFYAGTHGQYLRDRIDEVINQGLAVFVSEWGVSEASGTGGVFTEKTNEWVNFLNDRKISWVNWNLSDKDETSAVLMPGASPTGGWTESELSEAGKLVRGLIRDQAGDIANYTEPQLSTVTRSWVENEALSRGLQRLVERADDNSYASQGLLRAYERLVISGERRGVIGAGHADALITLSRAL